MPLGAAEDRNFLVVVVVLLRSASCFAKSIPPAVVIERLSGMIEMSVDAVTVGNRGTDQGNVRRHGYTGPHAGAERSGRSAILWKTSPRGTLSASRTVGGCVED